jgi:transcription elongation GreA/GreB family factor
MSVAFRRDSDDEHLEPKFDIPLPPGPNLVTARGLELIRTKVAELEAALEAAADEEARKAVRRDLKYWHTRETSAEIAPVPDEDEVAFGSRVTYRLGGKDATVELVGSDEAEPAAGRIPFTAPLAQALIGLAPGDSEDFGGRELTVVATGPIPA